MNLDIFHIRTNQKEKQAKEKGAEKWQRMIVSLAAASLNGLILSFLDQ